MLLTRWIALLLLSAMGRMMAWHYSRPLGQTARRMLDSVDLGENGMRTPLLNARGTVALPIVWIVLLWASTVVAPCYPGVALLLGTDVTVQLY